MKILLLTLIFFLSLNAFEIDKLPELIYKKGLAYKKFENKPFTGDGKSTVKDRNKCKILMAQLKNGLPNGDIEIWSCEGFILKKGKVFKNKSIGLFEAWDEKGNKTSSLIYDNNGQPMSGFSKLYYEDEILEDLIYSHGKKTGWKKEYSKDYTKTYKVTYKNDKVAEKVEIK